MRKMERRDFLGVMAAGSAMAACQAFGREDQGKPARPNIVFVFADQWRAQATGYAGDSNAITPHLDKLAAESVNFTHAVSGQPVCSPYRASLLTGQYWLTHGVFMNDVPLRDEAVSIAEVLDGEGYDTAYIGKWHLDGHGRSSYIPPERRQGFQFWRAQECTHDYNRSCYFADDDTPRQWEGYDAIAQTREAQGYIRDHVGKRPFALFLSWGPPHAPYDTAPEAYKEKIKPEAVALRPNVPEDHAATARHELAGYYAHIAALDTCLGELRNTLEETHLAENTIFVFTSDHGDMLHCHGFLKKQQPYDESIRVPFLLRYPALLGTKGRSVNTPLNAPDIMPTLLGLCGIKVPDTAEGMDFSSALRRGETPQADAALLMCSAPFGQWTRKQGGREYRGIRTRRYTYVRDLTGPWLLFDNEADPYQQFNLCGKPEQAALQNGLDQQLNLLLAKTRDTFQPAAYYLDKWGYHVDDTGTVPYTP